MSANDNYKKIPALAAYIDRIGAEQLNFRRFMVKEYTGHYYTEKATIRINADGEIKSSEKKYAPTEEEATKIKGALMEMEWPKAIPVKNIDKLLSITKASKTDMYIFYIRNVAKNAANIAMVQERRVNKKTGLKSYLPWTFFSDNEWRMMEPDGALPFWKPKEKTSSRIMIHEGAKSAQYMQWMIEAEDDLARNLRANHPWADELADYEHWGMIGGALAPHRADYDELEKEKPTEVVYVCDNDWAGNAALSEVSRHWGRSLRGIQFDTRWPTSWDLGDPFTGEKCPKLFSKSGRYNGPALRDLSFPATWATDLKYSGKQGKPVTIIKRNFKEEWLHCVKPEVFIHKSRPNDLHTLSEFNSMVSPFSDVDDTARLLKKDQVGKGAILCYEPGRPAGLYGSVDHGQYINTHVPTHIKPEKMSVALFEEFLKILCPEEADRHELKRWCATLIARPDIKILYGVLLISETQGVGKTTLGEKILAPLVGISNVSYPSESDIVDSAFNYWIAHKRLAIVNEIYAGHSSKGYDRLKSIITDKVITVSKKYQANYEIENWMHIFACSNSMRALKMGEDDRRWFVPRITEEKEDFKFWDKLNKWLTNEGGLSGIRQWAIDFCKKEGAIQTGVAAPWSSVKQEVIEESMSPGMLLVSDTLDRIKETMNGSKVAIPDMTLVDLIKNKIYDGRQVDRLERPLTIRKLARSKGWFVSKNRSKIPLPNGTIIQARILSWRKEVCGMTPKQLEEQQVSILNPNDEM